MKKAWPTKSLGEVCEIIMGQSPDGESYNTTGEGVPLINGPVEFSEGPFGKTVRTKFTTQPTKFCRANDLILCVRGSTTGKTNIADFDACIGRGVAAIRAREFQPWINYFVISQRDKIHGTGTGSTFPNVSGQMVSEFKLVMPPLPEQRRIAGILDEVFAGIAAAKAQTEQNRKNARALFESHLHAVFTHRGPGWVETTVGELVSRRILEAPIDGNHGEIHPKKADFVEVGVPFLMASDLKGGVVDQENCTFISRKQADSLRKGFAKHGDVLLSHKGTIGRVAILDTDHDYVVLTPQVTYYRIADIKTLSNHFLFYALQAPTFVSVMSELAGAGSTRAYIGITKQHELPLAFPPLEQQKRFATQLDALSIETRRLETLYARKLSALDELKAALLHQAFSGEL